MRADALPFAEAPVLTVFQGTSIAVRAYRILQSGCSMLEQPQKLLIPQQGDEASAQEPKVRLLPTPELLQPVLLLRRAGPA